MSITFDVALDQNDDLNTLLVNYPIFVSNTTVGRGITSIDGNNSAVVGVGTTFIDNIYYVHGFTRNNLTGIITANVLSTTDYVGLETSGSISNPCGTFSWGRLSGFTRGSESIGIAVSGFTVNSGLTTYPTIQRRGFGSRDNGSLRKQL